MPKKDRRNATAQKADAEEGFVRLKPLLGVAPGTYLTVLFGLVILLALFLLLFLPGLRRRGSYLSVAGTPSGATVQIDGRYAGTTPCRVYVPRGTHELEVVRPYFSASRSQIDAPARIFATLIVPQVEHFSYSLSLEDEAGYYHQALLDLVHNPDVPSIAPNTVRDALIAGASTQEASTFVDSILYFVSNSEQLRSFVQALALLTAHGGIATLGSIEEIGAKIAQLTAIYDNMPALVLLSLDKEMQNKLLSTSWAQRYAQRLSTEVAGLMAAPVGDSAAARVGSKMEVGGVAFRTIPSGTLLMGKDDSAESATSINQLLPHPVAIERFLMAQTEVTNRQFRTFVEAVPLWRASNRKQLVDRGLASEGYLADWSENAYPAGSDELPVTGVSWHAAAAYCEWLTGRAVSLSPKAMVRLPSEAEWEWAARGGVRGSAYPSGDKPGASRFLAKDVTGPGRVGTSGANGYGLSDMAGNVWEWCADSWAPAAYLLSSFDPAVNLRLLARTPVTDEKVVRGGAWSTQRELAKVTTRGVQPADWCTPYLGFRPVLVLP